MISENLTLSQEPGSTRQFFDPTENDNELTLTIDSSNTIHSGFFQKDLMSNSFDNDFPKFNFDEYNVLEEEEKKNENNIYFFENQEKQYDNLDENNLLKKRGRGNKKSLNSSSSEKGKKIHDKNSTDNLLRKIQVHYLSFIISFLNAILENLNYKQRFLKLDYNFKKNVNKNFVDSLKEKTIKEVICNKISCKYRKQEKDANKAICEEIKNDKILNNILSENYLSLFKKIYYKNNGYVNLKEYGLDKEIHLSKNVKIFKDLIEAYDSNEEKDYKKNIRECASQNYLPNSLFLLS